MQAKLVGFFTGMLLIGMAVAVPAQVVAQYDEACKRDPAYARNSGYCLCSKDKHSDACKCIMGDKAACERAYPTKPGKGWSVK